MFMMFETLKKKRNLVAYEKHARIKCSQFFKVENNSLELTRIFKENIMTDCEREKKV